MNNGLIYGVSDKPSWGKTIVFAIQQVLAILAATIAVPAIINASVAGANMSQSAALFGAGVGTIVYLLFTKFKSPVFLGSSFAFIGSMITAFAGAVSMSVGYLGLIIGAVLAGLIYVILSIIVKFCGTGWIKKLMPAVVIGPVVAIIGLSLAGNAVGDVLKGAPKDDDGNFIMSLNIWLELLVALVTLGVTVAVSVFGKKTLKTIPFICGIGAGYVVATIITLIGMAANNNDVQIISWKAFEDMQWYPDFAFLQLFGEYDFGSSNNFITYFGTIAVAYIPVALVVFAEHIADHKNLSSIIGSDLLEEPGLHRTLLGDGIGSMAGAVFGGCPNTTYGESVGCVAISGNASIRTILVTAIMAIGISFIAPITTFLATIPSCVMGGICITLYGFIAVSGLKMIQPVDLGDNRNLFVVAVILITGIGGMALRIEKIVITRIAVALILGILVNLLCSIGRKTEDKKEEIKEEPEGE